MSKKIFCLVDITCIVAVELVSDHLKPQSAVWPSPELHPNVTFEFPQCDVLDMSRWSPIVQCGPPLLVVCGQGRGQGCGCGLQRAGHNTQTISTNHPHITAPRDCRYITEKTLWYWDSNLKSQSHVGCVISLNSHLSLSLISHWSMMTATYVH